LANIKKEEWKESQLDEKGCPTKKRKPKCEEIAENDKKDRPIKVQEIGQSSNNDTVFQLKIANEVIKNHWKHNCLQTIKLCNIALIRPPFVFENEWLFEVL